MAEQKPDPTELILDLDALTQRKKVKIDSVLYELRDPGELGVFDYHRLQRDWKVVNALSETDEPSDDQVAAAQRAVDAVCRELLLAPPAVHEKLSDSHRMRICDAFMRLLRDAPQLDGAPPAAAVTPAIAVMPAPEPPPEIERPITTTAAIPTGEN